MTQHPLLGAVTGREEIELGVLMAETPNTPYPAEGYLDGKLEDAKLTKVCSGLCFRTAWAPVLQPLSPEDPLPLPYLADLFPLALSLITF